MSEIIPFKGLLYNGSMIEDDYACVMAPPYDVIPKYMQDVLYEKSEHNIIRLILGKDEPGDSKKNNKYTRAKKSLADWQKQNILVRDENPSFYVYAQEYSYKNRKHRRIGFLGLMKIGEPEEDSVLPHEYTLAKPKEDRLNLIKQVEGNLSPIFTLFDDTSGTIDSILENVTSQSPVIDIKIDAVRHRLWRLSNEGPIKTITREMKDKKVFIADGHHRYEVARTYRDMRRKEDSYDGSADYIMMYFTNMAEEDNLTIMATHRVIKELPKAHDDELAEKLCHYFELTECSDLASLMEGLEKERKEHTFGFIGDGKYVLMVPKNDEELVSLIKDEKSDQWKELDVSVLHSAVFDNILGINKLEGNITYVRDAEEAEKLVKDGSHMAAFLLNPTKVEQLEAVAKLGEMMPQKSTYFYPKLLTGLVINKFNKTVACGVK